MPIRLRNLIRPLQAHSICPIPEPQHPLKPKQLLSKLCTHIRSLPLAVTLVHPSVPPVYHLRQSLPLLPTLPYMATQSPHVLSSSRPQMKLPGQDHLPHLEGITVTGTPSTLLLLRSLSERMVPVLSKRLYPPIVKIIMNRYLCLLSNTEDILQVLQVPVNQQNLLDTHMPMVR